MKETFDDGDAEILKEFELSKGVDNYRERSGYEDSGTRLQSYPRSEEYQDHEIRRKSKKNQPSVFDPSRDIEEDVQTIVIFFLMIVKLIIMNRFHLSK